MSELKRDILVNAPIEDVFAYVNEPTKMAEWLPGLVEVRDVVGTGEGQQFEWTYKMMGFLLRGQTVVVDFASNQCFTHQSVGTIAGTWIYEFESSDAGTRVTMDCEYEMPATVLRAVATHLAVRRNTRDIETALLNIKESLEQ